MKDLHGREITYLRLSVTESCNLRCRYCMPGETEKEYPANKVFSAKKEFLTEDEMIQAVEVAASLGISRLRITGGEPLVRPDILSICERAAKVPGITEAVMTTNAVLLSDKAEGLFAAGIRRLNVSLDTLDPEKYTWITRSGTLDKAVAGIEAALTAGFEKIKINVVLIGGFNDDEIPTLASLTRRWPVDVRFIELMPMPGSMRFEKSAFIPCSRVLEKLPEAVPVYGDTSADNESVAKLYQLPGAIGRIGLISPLSEPFCSTCCRLRLTADGKLKPCLHSGPELSIRGLDRTRMEEQFKAAIMAKPEWHGGLALSEGYANNRCMNQIGG